MKVIKLLMNEIENTIEDKLVPIISTIIGPSSNHKVEKHSRDESYERELENSTPHYSDENEKIPYIQNENGFI